MTGLLKWIAKAIGYFFLVLLFFASIGYAQENPAFGSVMWWVVLIAIGGKLIYSRSKNTATTEFVTTRVFGSELEDILNIELHNNILDSEPNQAECYELSSSGMSSGKRYKITYVDSNGKKTERVIKPFRIDKYYVDAYCELRREERTFSFDRIKQIIDASTGEIIIFPHAKHGDKIYKGKRGGYYVLDNKGRKKYLTQICE